MNLKHHEMSAWLSSAVFTLAMAYLSLADGKAAVFFAR
jgi:hypothetical protein